MMRQFIQAGSVEAAVALLADHGEGCALVAGGTDLMVEIRRGHVAARHLIDIGGLEELRYIREEGGLLRIGACMTHSECRDNPIVAQHAPLLAEACSWVGSLQIRNRGTLGGNIISAAACADSVPALIVLNARCSLTSAAGTRELPIAELITGPNETVRRADEICTEIVLEKTPEGARHAFIKLIRRNSVAKSRLTVAALARQERSGQVQDLRLAAGSCTPRPHRNTSVEQMFLGNRPTEDLLQKAGEKVAGEMIEASGYRWSTEYKERVVKALTARALRAVLEV